ncbi:ubiquinol-cytochrome C chaperone family protein [Shumkonia mesophila]|uniref:ubiquinol-cytochrome C chaperone family protein n=1 Tax=Shumkonia mesophila TaxID=2838854 RepID=UPI00293445A8|nr:ubiquinol-cytochrome C chaperone family protein [Shumkonia mesophila]
MAAVFGFFRKSPEKEPARRLYSAILARAREATFYEDFGVPDTVDGRFDMVALHAFLLLRRLKRDRPATARLSQELFDLMFIDMDENLREMGVGDLSVGRRVKDMAKAFLGRVAAYEDALERGDGEALAAALRRNLFRGVVAEDGRHIAAMAGYVRGQEAGLTGLAIETLLAGDLAFPPVAAERKEGT